ncbi:MAG: 3-hydroxybutyryl-CoA dehydrogenase [Euryarchaeota archaeon]|nr:3-hydroxybutyryl-CoA dehydrogenase [Euryarchaeota archaeon]MDE1837765.1 3-hydroxybutyryl-CoA dehydrogenase [Euryarchaeota archaeon]MDE1880196.1 3-hydroxybutyryl-CoA dehydrogenase [Euryarchaeota archaeon]MDE2045413.1 3-hydroxybutyryl-CoA dehydrogenase [Thermoplasmata archaeon]
MPASRLFVAGAGIMGAGIAAQAALVGWEVDLYDVQQSFLDRGLGAVRKDFERLARKGKLTAEQGALAGKRVRGTLSLDAAGEASVVMEAAPERLELKRELFQKLDKVCRPEALLGTNTSSLSVTAIAATVKDPGRMVGIHFFNPVLAMELVEVIPGFRTRETEVARAKAFARALGKTVTSSKDAPGFVTTRAMAVLANEAIWMLHDGVATREDIDTAHKLGFHHPMGPLELADLVGLDTMLSVLERLYTGFRDPKYRACPLLVSMVEAGLFGRKSGEGFYRYDVPRPGGTSTS